MKNVYQIREYGSFITGRVLEGYTTLPAHTFDQLENFILTNQSKNTDALQLMGLSARKGIGKVITAMNYVGIITMNDGTIIEILPKIVSAIKDDSNGTKAKQLLIAMLKTLRDTPYKNLQTSHVDIEKMNILEVFIRMFIDEVFFIVKRGLKRSYQLVSENTTFFKGKIQFSQQIKYNYSHKERSFVEYDIFNVNCPENRLLKATLQYLYKQSSSSRNKSDIKTLLYSFSDVPVSTDYSGDFAAYHTDRSTKDYHTALLWCKVFLTGRSFTAYAGSEVALALLFPMETLFESYVAALLKKELRTSPFSVSVQDSTYHLFDNPKRFAIRPDIVIRGEGGKNTIVLDTKWKLLAGDKHNYGISQADMYQMYVYQKKYAAKKMILLYPQTDCLVLGTKIEYLADDNVIVQVELIDLFNAPQAIKQLCSRFTET